MGDVLDQLEISVRTTNVLRNRGVTTIDDFMALTRPVVMKMEHAGAKTWREIADVQTSLGRSRAPATAVQLLAALNALELPADHGIIKDRGGKFRLVKLVDGFEFY